MSEAIAEVKDKAKNSLDELCSMVETLLVSTYTHKGPGTGGRPAPL